MKPRLLILASLLLATAAAPAAQYDFNYNYTNAQGGKSPGLVNLAPGAGILGIDPAGGKFKRYDPTEFRSTFGLISSADLLASIQTKAAKTPPLSRTLFFTPASSYVAPTVGSATLGFSRSFNATGLTSAGLYTDFTNQVAAYTFDPTINALRYHSTLNHGSGALSNYRDLTNAAWTKTNVTAAKNQVGIDGVSNAASAITATAANGTVLQGRTLAAASQTFSAWVKRLAGGGQVCITSDGGTTWEDVTSRLRVGTWTRVSMTSSVTDPSVGFRLSVSGDSIAVDSIEDTTTSFLAPTSLAGGGENTSELTYSSILPATIPGRRYYLSADVVFTGESGSVILSDATGVTSNSAYLSIGLANSAAKTIGLGGASYSGTVNQYNTASYPFDPPAKTGDRRKVGLIFGQVVK